MYIVVLLVFFLLLYNLYIFGKTSSVLRMSTWIFVAYSFLFLTHAFSGITYNVGNMFRILPYVLLCLVLMMLGENVGIRAKSYRIKDIIRVRLSLLGQLAVLGAILLIYDLFRLNEVQIGNRIPDHQISIIGVFGNVLASLGLIAWLYSLYEYIINKVRIPFLSYLAILSYISGGIVSAGRQSILLIGLSSMILLLWGLKKNGRFQHLFSLTKIKKVQPWGVYFVIALFVVYFLFISSNRSRISDINLRIKSYEFVFNARTSEQAIQTGVKLGPMQDIYMEFIYYYSQELIRLDLLFKDYDFPPLFGLSQFSYVERRIQWLVGDKAERSWNEVENVLEKKNKFTAHSWGTFIVNYIIDFGRFGALIACFITGFIFGIVFKDLQRKESPMSVIRLAILCAGVVFSIQFSPFSELTWTIPVILSSFVLVLPGGKVPPDPIEAESFEKNKNE